MFSRIHHNESDRRTLLLAATAGVLLSLGLIVRLWPALPEQPAPPLPPAPEHIVTIEEIVSTTQSAAASTPPPPPDLPPVEVEEVEIEEVQLTLDVPFVPAPPVPGPPSEAPPGEDDTTQRPSGGISRDASPVRMVQPSYTDEAQRRRIRAEVVVEVRVDENGRVAAARITERYLLDRRGERSAVSSLDYGLEDVALQTARRWLFRPALRNGKKVEQAYPITLRWGTGN